LVPFLEEPINDLSFMRKDKGEEKGRRGKGEASVILIFVGSVLGEGKTTVLGGSVIWVGKVKQRKSSPRLKLDKP